MAYKIPFEVPGLSYGEALEALESAQRFGICPLLETVEEMLDELDRPDGTYGIVQVAGTNGKTSTSRFSAAALASCGLRCALYTSPELVAMEERMEVAGRPVSPERFSEGIAAAVEAGRRVNGRREALGAEPYDITQFDLLTVGALVVFALEAVDVTVLEVGMGGRWDATTATHPRTVAITGIGLDHTRILGDTLEAIAGEKAGAVKAGQHCVMGPGTFWPPSVERVILDRCAEVGATPVRVIPKVPGDFPGDAPEGTVEARPDLLEATYTILERPTTLEGSLALSLTTPWAHHPRLETAHPAFQAANVAVAVTLCEAYLGHGIPDGPLAAALATTGTPGRFERLRREPLLMVDAAHNPQSIQIFLDTMAAMAPAVEERPELLCAILADKDVDTMVGQLVGEFPAVHVCATASPRCLDPAELAERFTAQGQAPVTVHGTVGEALEALGEVPLACVGSITLAGEVVGCWEEIH